jgi:hypothetical protein
LLTLRPIRLHELADYLASEEYRSGLCVPISRIRAESQLRNPAARPDDAVLVLAHWDGVLIGYVGALPGLLGNSEDPVRVGWLSCFWIHPGQRGKGVADRLLDEMLGHWQGRVLITEFTPQAQKLYDRSGRFRPADTICGQRAYLRPDLAGLLAPKNDFFVRTALFWRALDRLLGFPCRIWLRAWTPQKMPAFEYLSALDTETWEFVRARQGGEWAARTRAELDWIVRSPWLHSAPEKDDNAKRYFFSSVAGDFRFFSIKILGKKRETIGYLMLSLRDGHLRVLYAYFDEENAPEVAQVLAWHCCKLPVAHLTVFRPETWRLLSQMPPIFFLKRNFRRPFLNGRDTGAESAFDRVQDGVADTAFT